MLDFKIMYYILMVVVVLLVAIFAWGYVSYKKAETSQRMMNLNLVIATSIVGAAALICSFVPLGLQIWTYDSSEVKSSAMFISLLIVEFLLTFGFLFMAYMFSYDFGMAVTKEELVFFGQSVPLKNLSELKDNRRYWKIVYVQGERKVKKGLIFWTPSAKAFIKQHLIQIIEANGHATVIIDDQSPNTPVTPIVEVSNSTNNSETNDTNNN